MFRQSPGRNQRSKGIRVKHVLQICFLIAICFWLIYQVKHSHDKKKEFDENDAKISVRTQSSNEVPKLGRKDLHPKVEEAATTIRQQDEEAEEEESVGEEEESKHEEEQQQEDQKFEDNEDEGKGVGEDELDEHEQEKSDAEVDREEEVTEEEKDKEEGDEKESEENDSEDNNGHLENESSLEDHDDDDDGTAKSTHEAREEHYKADDASSAVTHETQIVAAENENEDSENSNELSEMNKSANESQVIKYSVGENTTHSKTEEREMIQNSLPVNTTANDAVDDVASKSEDSSLSSNSTLVEQSNDHRPLVKNTTEVITGADGSSMQNGMETQRNPSHLENVALDGTTSGDGSNLQNVSLDQDVKSSLDSRNHEGDSKLATSVKTGETVSGSEETSKADNSSEPAMSEKSTNSSLLTGDSSGSSTTESNNTTESEKLVTDNGTGSKENDALKTEIPVEVQNDPIDSSDSSVAVRTDLETLPERQTEANNDEDAAAE